MTTIIYLDESGDLGWKFDAPYQKGGSSRYLTLVAAVLDTSQIAQLERAVRGLYKARGRKLSSELKSIHLSSKERAQFARKIVEIKEVHPRIEFFAITVSKERVNQAFKDHPNGLYNYMVKLLLIDVLKQHPEVDFIPDARSISTELKHSLHDYLRTELAIVGAQTQLITTPFESKNSLALQFVDIVASIVWARHEFMNLTHTEQLNSVIHAKQLFFAQP